MQAIGELADRIVREITGRRPMRTVKRADLAEAVQNAFPGMSATDAAGYTEQVIAEICNTLARGEPVKISRFAVFTPVKAKPRLGRNPKRPSEQHEIPEHCRISFKPMAELKEQVNGGVAPPGPPRKKREQPMPELKHQVDDGNRRPAAARRRR